MRAYHITPSEYALSDIALRRIKIATFGDLNDPFELLSISLGFDPVREAFVRWKEEIARSQGMLCFSKSWESPVLWSHYGAKHTGICLGFDIDDSLVAKVEYVGERTNIPTDDDGSVQFDEDFMNRLLRTKYEHWSYEEEVRAFVDLDQKTAERGMFFLEFSEKLRLREVILGPLCEIPPATVFGLISSIFIGVTVTKAALAYKWYRVVGQQEFQCSS